MHATPSRKNRRTTHAERGGRPHGAALAGGCAALLLASCAEGVAVEPLDQSFVPQNASAPDLDASLLSGDAAAAPPEVSDMSDAGSDASGEPWDPADAGHSEACSDGTQNGDETDVDCGGSSCAGCGEGAACLSAADCEGMACTGGVCGTCDPAADADDDGTGDCDDLCPGDAAKTAPGECGCGVEENVVDTDSDGTPDCLDACPADPTTDVEYACGACTCECTEGWEDCDGDPTNGCEHDSAAEGRCFPDTECTKATFDGRDYFFCRNDSSVDDARAKCQGVPNTDLASVTSAEENSFLQSQIGADAWLGGSDAAVADEWRWLEADSVFWRGRANGSAEGYANWRGGEPNDSGGNEDCVYLATGGQWNDEPCSRARDFICETSAP